MELKNLLLHVDGTKASDGCIDAAVALAEAHGAHVAALYCVPEYQIPGWARWSDATPASATERGSDERAESALAAFTGKAEATGISHETRTVRVAAERIGEEVALHARYADMAVLGQVDPDDPPAAGHEVVEQVVLACGRPALVIPYIGPPRREGRVAFGERAMIAWDAGREATRAVNDALPLLERAGAVDLVMIDPVRGVRGHGEEPGADLAVHLARHGLEVEVKRVEGHALDPGDMLLARLSDAGSDLLVMGLYGHSRVRELVLGGVTRSVLAQMPVPVLLSH